jgi:hypothetical protein
MQKYHKMKEREKFEDKNKSRGRSTKWQIDIISREATDKDNILVSEVPRKFLFRRYYRCYNEINTVVLY